MKLISPKELSKEELLTNLSSILDKWVSTSSKILIEEMKLHFVVDEVKYDISNNGEELVFNLNSELDLNTNESPGTKNYNSEINSEAFLVNDINEWMFFIEPNVNIPSEIENELEFIGNTSILVGYNEENIFPVYSIEKYCVKRKLQFLKNFNEQFLPKSLLVSLISLNSIEKIPTVAIYFSDNEFHNCVHLSDIENILDTKIYTNLKDKFSLVTEDSINNSKLTKHLKTIEPVGMFFSWSYFNDNQFQNVFDIYSMMEENGLCLVSNKDFEEKRLIDYLPESHLNYFPKELKLKEKAVIHGVRIEDGYFSREIRLVYKTDQILSKCATLIHEKDLNHNHFQCPIALLHKLKREFSSLEKMEEYNKLSPTGFTTNNELIFDSIPSNIQEIMNLHKLEYKEKERLAEIKKTKAKLKQSDLL